EVLNKELEDNQKDEATQHLDPTTPTQSKQGHNYGKNKEERVEEETEEKEYEEGVQRNITVVLLQSQEIQPPDVLNDDARHIREVIQQDRVAMMKRKWQRSEHRWKRRNNH
ncbi:hypothetical protein HAX54_013597, partial [Datura stramonium]|nr:hypothetical protein [Datura stramonium]